MSRWFALLLFVAQVLGITACHAVEATPNEMYAQAVRIEQEIDLLKRHFKVTTQVHAEAKSGDIKPRHIRAKSHILLHKLGKLRRQNGLAYVAPGDSEPTLDTGTGLPWGTLQRILTEIQIIKHYLAIPGQARAAQPVSGKRGIDVYNKLHQISAELDLLTSPVSPSEVYGEVKRLNEDVDAVLRHLRLFDSAVPPARRENLQPRDSLRAEFALLDEIQRIQRGHGLDTVDFKGFDMGDRTTPDDVFGMVELTLAEWQRVKARVGLTHLITGPASFEENKAPADVVQLLGYVTDKMKLIRSR
jgi:hypothetical protein